MQYEAPERGRRESIASPVQAKTRGGPNLRGLSFDEQSAALAPAEEAPPESGGDVVQKKDDGGSTSSSGSASDKSATSSTTSTAQGASSGKKPIAALNPAAVDVMVGALRGSKTWTSSVEAYAQATNWGYVPLIAADRGLVLGGLFTAIASQFEFPKGQTLASFQADNALVGRLVEAVQADVFKNSPTDVWGRLTGNATLKDKDGVDAIVPASKVVKLVKVDKSQMTVSGRVGGKEVKGVIEQKLFAREPGLSAVDAEDHPDKSGQREEYSYAEFKPDKGKEATPTGAEPSASDVSQGALGDCYLMSAMGAVAAQRPDLIQKMVKYDAANNIYTVTFKERTSGGKFKDVPIKVSAFLPSKSGAGAVYAQDAATKQGNDAALWPAIIEKAYAAWKGDYETIVGGVPGDAMEAMTGTKSSEPEVPPEKDVIKLFQSYGKDKKAVCAGTRSQVAERSTRIFSGSGAGPYHASLTAGGATPVKLVEKSLKVTDSGKKAGDAKDQGKGKMGGSDVSGHVEYEPASVDLTYKSGKAPAKAENLQADYRYEEVLDAGLNLHGDHAYMFVKVEGDKIVFANPWGPNASYQPKPVSAAQFVKYFDAISVNGPPKLKNP